MPKFQTTGAFLWSQPWQQLKYSSIQLWRSGKHASVEGAGWYLPQVSVKPWFRSVHEQVSQLGSCLSLRSSSQFCPQNLWYLSQGSVTINMKKSWKQWLIKAAHSRALKIELSNLKWTWRRWAWCHLSCHGSYSCLSSAPPAQTWDPAAWQHSQLPEPVRHSSDSDGIKAASLLSLKTKPPFAVSSAETGGKQTLKWSLSMMAPAAQQIFHCSTYCLS